MTICLAALSNRGNTFPSSERLRYQKSAQALTGTRPDKKTARKKANPASRLTKDGNVTVDWKGNSVVLKCGGATLTVGNSKVSIS